MKKILLILILLFLSNCTITKYEKYEFKIVDISEEKNDTNSKLFISISSTRKYIKTGILREKYVYKEPYYYDCFAIYGLFDKIEKLEAYFIQNKTKKIPILISENDLYKKKYSTDIRFVFLYEKKLISPITWDETESLEAEVNFIGVEKDGTKKEYKLKREFEKEFTIEYTTPIFEAIMGV